MNYNKNTYKLCIKIKHATLLRNLRTVTEMNPFVQLNFQGIQKKSKIAENSGKSPKWNEDMCFGVEVKDKGIFGQQLIGEGLATLKDFWLYADQFDNETIGKINMNLFYQGKPAGQIFLQAKRHEITKKQLRKIHWQEQQSYHEDIQYFLEEQIKRRYPTNGDDNKQGSLLLRKSALNNILQRKTQRERRDISEQYKNNKSLEIKINRPQTNFSRFKQQKQNTDINSSIPFKINFNVKKRRSKQLFKNYISDRYAPSAPLTKLTTISTSRQRTLGQKYSKNRGKIMITNLPLSEAGVPSQAFKEMSKNYNFSSIY